MQTVPEVIQWCENMLIEDAAALPLEENEEDKMWVAGRIAVITELLRALRG